MKKKHILFMCALVKFEEKKLGSDREITNQRLLNEVLIRDYVFIFLKHLFFKWPVLFRPPQKKMLH